uniref:chitinase n=1 Tax=Glossina pallidipes TaxID=7398 RepID=A0A1A9Z6A5_GLOPL
KILKARRLTAIYYVNNVNTHTVLKNVNEAYNGFKLPKGALWSAFVLLWTLLFINGVNSEGRIVCYYTNWSVYRPGTAKFNPQNINPYLCTHLIYAFGGFTKDNQMKPFDKYQDIEQGGYAKFTGLKTYNKQLKTMIAIGGWNEASSRFSPLVANPERRQKFIKNILKFLRQNHFDGIDLDWEYPAHREGGKPGDRDNYAQFVQELRAEFERESEKTGRQRLLLTMAVPAGIEYIEKGYDIPKLNKYLDWFNVLTYDFHSSHEPSVNHHAPLYPLEEDSEYNYDAELNIDYSIKYYLKAGADRNKLVLGIPTYGRSYTLINEESTEIGAPAEGPGEQGDATREKGYLAFYEICNNIKEDPDWEVVQPNINAMGPYAYRRTQWVGYDDEAIVRKKAQYVVEHGLGGIMFWSIDNDDFRGTCTGKPYPLIEAAKESMFDAMGLGINEVSKPSAPRKSNRSRNHENSIGTRNRINVGDKLTYEERKESSRRTSNQETRKRLQHSTTRSPSSTTIRLTEAEGSSLYIGGRTTTPPPPTTPDPGTDFKCEDEGFYQHPRDCKKYYWCLDSGPSGLGIVAHQFTCPSGLYFNPAADSCDFARNVPCKTKKSTTVAPVTKSYAGTSVATTAKPTASVNRITAATARTTFFRATSTTAHTTTTTAKPPVEEEDYMDVEEQHSEEDPKVIKELIELIRRVGGIEELEKHLLRKDDGTISFKQQSSSSSNYAESTTSSSISKSLYDKVLSRPNALNSFRNRLIPSNSYRKTEQFDREKSDEESEMANENDTNNSKSTSEYSKYSSVVRGNSRQGPQNEGLDKLPEFSGFLKERKQYVTINRNRGSQKKIERVESDEEDIAATIRSEQITDKPFSVTTPSYTSIRRTRPSTTASLIEEEDFKDTTITKPHASLSRMHTTDASSEQADVNEDLALVKYKYLERARSNAEASQADKLNENKKNEEQDADITHQKEDQKITVQLSAAKADYSTQQLQEQVTTIPVTQRTYVSLGRRTTTTASNTETSTPVVLVTTTPTETSTAAPNNIENLTYQPLIALTTTIATTTTNLPATITNTSPSITIIPSITSDLLSSSKVLKQEYQLSQSTLPDSPTPDSTATTLTTEYNLQAIKHETDSPAITVTTEKFSTPTIPGLTDNKDEVNLVIRDQNQSTVYNKIMRDTTPVITNTLTTTTEKYTSFTNRNNTDSLSSPNTAYKYFGGKREKDQQKVLSRSSLKQTTELYPLTTTITNESINNEFLGSVSSPRPFGYPKRRGRPTVSSTTTVATEVTSVKTQTKERPSFVQKAKLNAAVTPPTKVSSNIDHLSQNYEMNPLGKELHNHDLSTTIRSLDYLQYSSKENKEKQVLGDAIVEQDIGLEVDIEKEHLVDNNTKEYGTNIVDKANGNLISQGNYLGKNTSLEVDLIETQYLNVNRTSTTYTDVIRNRTVNNQKENFTLAERDNKNSENQNKQILNKENTSDRASAAKSDSTVEDNESKIQITENPINPNKQIEMEKISVESVESQILKPLIEEKPKTKEIYKLNYVKEVSTTSNGLLSDSELERESNASNNEENSQSSKNATSLEDVMLTVTTAALAYKKNTSVQLDGENITIKSVYNDNGNESNFNETPAYNDILVTSSTEAVGIRNVVTKTEPVTTENEDSLKTSESATDFNSSTSIFKLSEEHSQEITSSGKSSEVEHLNPSMDSISVSGQKESQGFSNKLKANVERFEGSLLNVVQRNYQNPQEITLPQKDQKKLQLEVEQNPPTLINEKLKMQELDELKTLGIGVDSKIDKSLDFHSQVYAENKKRNDSKHQFGINKPKLFNSDLETVKANIDKKYQNISENVDPLISLVTNKENQKSIASELNTKSSLNSQNRSYWGANNPSKQNLNRKNITFSSRRNLINRKSNAPTKHSASAVENESITINKLGDSNQNSTIRELSKTRKAFLRQPYRSRNSIANVSQEQSLHLQPSASNQVSQSIAANPALKRKVLRPRNQNTSNKTEEIEKLANGTTIIRTIYIDTVSTGPNTIKTTKRIKTKILQKQEPEYEDEDEIKAADVTHRSIVSNRGSAKFRSNDLSSILALDLSFKAQKRREDEQRNRRKFLRRPVVVSETEDVEEFETELTADPNFLENSVKSLKASTMDPLAVSSSQLSLSYNKTPNLRELSTANSIVNLKNRGTVQHFNFAGLSTLPKLTAATSTATTLLPASTEILPIGDERTITGIESDIFDANANAETTNSDSHDQNNFDELSLPVYHRRKYYQYYKDSPIAYTSPIESSSAIIESTPPNIAKQIHDVFNISANQLETDESEKATTESSPAEEERKITQEYDHFLMTHPRSQPTKVKDSGETETSPNMREIDVENRPDSVLENLATFNRTNKPVIRKLISSEYISTNGQTADKIINITDQPDPENLLTKNITKYIPKFTAWNYSIENNSTEEKTRFLTNLFNISKGEHSLHHLNNTTFSHTYNHSLDTHPYVNRLRPSKLSNITEKIKSNFTKTFIKDLEHQQKISTPSTDNNPQHPTIEHISTTQSEKYHFNRSRFLTPTLHPITTGVATTSTTTTEKYATKESQDSAHVASVKVNYLVDVEQTREIKEYNLESSTIIIPESTTPETLSSPAPTLRRIKILRHRRPLAGLTNNSYLPENVTSARITNTTTTANIETQNSDILSTVRQADEKLETTDIKYLTKTHNNINQTETFSLNTVTPPKRFRKIIRKIIKPMNLTNRPTITIKTTTETASTVKLTSTEPTIPLSSGKKQNSSRHDYNRNIKIPPKYQTKSNFDGKEDNNENALNVNKKNETLFAGKANKLNIQSANQTLKGVQQDRYKNKASSVSTKETSSFDDDDDDDDDNDNDNDDDDDNDDNHDDDDSYDENSDEQEESEYESVSDNVKEKNVHNGEGEMQNKEDTEIEEDLQTTNDDDDIVNLELEKATHTPLTYTDELEVTENNQDTARDAKSRIENIDFTKELPSDIPNDQLLHQNDRTGSNYDNINKDKNSEKISIPPSKLNSTARKTISKGLNVPNISQNGSQNDDPGKPLKTSNSQANEREENNSFKLFATASDEETIASSLKTFGTKRTKDLADAKTNASLIDASNGDEILNTELKKQVKDIKTEGETLTVQTLPETTRNSGEQEEQINVKTKIYSKERTAIQSSDTSNIGDETVSVKPAVRNEDNLDFYERNDDRKLIDAQILTNPEIGLTSEILQTTKRNLIPDTTIAPPSVRPTFRRKVIIKKPSLSVLSSTAKVPTSDSTKKYTRPNGGRFVPHNANNRKSAQNYVKNDSRTPPTFSISRLKAQDTLKTIPNEEYSRGSGDGAEEIIAKRKNVEEHEEVVSVLRPAIVKQFPLSKKTNGNSSKINKQLESVEEDDDYDDGEIEDEDEDEEDEEEDDEEEETESNRGTENSHNYVEKSFSSSQSTADKLPIATRPGGNIPFNSRVSNTPNRNESKNSYKNHSVETRAKSRSRIVNRPQGVAVPNLTIKPIALDFERTTVPVPTKPAPFVPSYTPSYERKYTGPSTEATALIDNINPLIDDLNIEALNARNKKIFDINSKKHTTLKPKLLIPTVKFSNQTNLESALESQVPNTVQNTAYEVHESYSSGQQSDGGFATTTTPKTLENTMGTNTEDKQHEYHINHDVNANEIFSQDHDNYLGLTTTQPPSTTLLHVFTLSDDEQSTRPSNSGADAIPRLIFERVRPKHKVIEINRVVEIHSKEEKLRRKSKANQIVPIGGPSPLKVESLPHVEQLGEISVVKYVHLVDGSDIKVEGHSTVTDYTPTESIIQKSSMPVRNSLPEDRESIDGILNQNDQYSPETSVIIRVSTSQESPPNIIQKRQGKALVPEVIREAVETSTISLEGLFENARKAKVSNTIDGTQKHIHINSQNNDAQIAVGSISTDSPEASDGKNMNISSNVRLIAWLNGSNGERQEIAVLQNSSLPFKHNDTEQKSTLSSQFIQEDSTTIGPNLGNFKVSTVPTTLFPTYVRPIVPLLRPESNESSPLVISIANLDKVILSKVKKTDSPALLTNNLHSSIVNPSLLSKSPQNVRLSNSFATTNNDKTLDSPISDDSRGASSNRLVSYIKPSTNPAKHPNLTEKKSKSDTPTEMYSILEGSSVGSTTTSALGSKISEIISFSTETHIL